MSKEANIPLMLLLEEMGGAYLNQLEHRLEVHSMTLRRSVAFLIQEALVEEVPYEGEQMNVKSQLVLTAKGHAIARCIQECQRKLHDLKSSRRPLG